MSKYDLTKLWNLFYRNEQEVYDYAGRRMVKSAIGNQNSSCCPTIDHIRPLSLDGKDEYDNIIICSQETNYEKADSFPTWNANGKTFQAKRAYNGKGYDIYLID